MSVRSSVWGDPSTQSLPILTTSCLGTISADLVNLFYSPDGLIAPRNKDSDQASTTVLRNSPPWEDALYKNIPCFLLKADIWKVLKDSAPIFLLHLKINTTSTQQVYRSLFEKLNSSYPLADKGYTLRLGEKKCTKWNNSNMKMTGVNRTCTLLPEGDQDNPRSKHPTAPLVVCYSPSQSKFQPCSSIPSQLGAPSPAWTRTCGRGGRKGVYARIAWSPSKWHSRHCSLPAPLVLQLQIYKEETGRDRRNDYTSSAWPPLYRIQHWENLTLHVNISLRELCQQICYFFDNSGYTALYFDLVPSKRQLYDHFVEILKL